MSCTIKVITTIFKYKSKLSTKEDLKLIVLTFLFKNKRCIFII